MRYRATVAYDGTAYHGFQRQQNTPLTIQGVLEAALARLSGGVSPAVIGAGRTDRGVHASGQVIAFDLNWRHSPEALRSALNANLPPDIAVMTMEPAAPGFHPRFDAISRTYRYRLYVASVRDPLRRLTAWQVDRKLNLDRMASASESLLGAHDFTAFGTPPAGESPFRVVSVAEWQADQDEYWFTITANAFLQRMVRRIVATLVQVGREVVTVEHFRGILAARARSLAAPPAPACGLTLVAVTYPEDGELRTERPGPGGHRGLYEE